MGNEKEAANLGYCYKMKHRNVTVLEGDIGLKDVFFFLFFKVVTL